MRTTPPVATLLTAEQQADLRRRSDLRGIGLVAHAWVTIVAAMAVYVWLPNVVTLIAAVMVIGSRQLGLLILMHDGAHNMLCRTATLNRILGQGLCAWPMLADLNVYQRYHLQHHARTLREDDPDRVLTGHYPITRQSLRRKMIRDLTGRSGFIQRRAQLLSALGPAEWPAARRGAQFLRVMGPQLGANAVLLGLCVAAGHGYLYLLLWLLPLLTWHQFVLRIRNIAEHAVVREAGDVFGNARTTLVNPLERVFVAPYWVNYHLEHHLLMWVPCARLPDLRAALIANGFGGRLETEHGYLAVLRKASSRDPSDDSGSAARRRARGTFSDGYQAPS